MRMTPALEDYLEAILVIRKQRGVVRVKDLADSLDVKAPSVHEAVCHLKERGFIEQEPYGHINLTSLGQARAQKILARHEILKRFFCDVLGLEEDLAEEDACKIEHYLSKQTIGRVLSFIEYAKSCPAVARGCLDSFQHYLRGK